MAPSLWNGKVIYASGDRVVRAFDQETGRLVWDYQFDYHTSSSTTVAGDRVYFGVDGNKAFYYGGLGDVPPKLVCLNAHDGRFLWEVPIKGRILSAPVIAGKWIVFGTDEHQFYVLEEVF
jgi:outer membrane protein assembly factor BamB